MKQFKGTPGTWSVSKTGRSVGSVGECNEQGLMLPVAWLEFYANPAIHQSNANLIAAAPELLEALQEMVNGTDAFHSALEVEHGFDGVKMIEKAKAAINKALGGE